MGQAPAEGSDPAANQALLGNDLWLIASSKLTEVQGRLQSFRISHYGRIMNNNFYYSRVK